MNRQMRIIRVEASVGITFESRDPRLGVQHDTVTEIHAVNLVVEGDEKIDPANYVGQIEEEIRTKFELPEQVKLVELLGTTLLDEPAIYVGKASRAGAVTAEPIKASPKRKTTSKSTPKKK